MAKNSDIIKIGFDYRASLEQFEKETNGVFDGISEKAGKQKISIQLDAKNDKVIEKIKELQKLKLDKFTFEFGESGLAEQLKTFDQLEKKINEIINLSKGLGGIVSKTDFGTKNKTEAYNQLKQMADVFKKFYGNEEAMHSKAGTDAAYAYYKAYEEALKKGVAQSKLERVTVDVSPDNFHDAYTLSSDRIKDFENFKKYGGDITDLSVEILSLEGKLLDFTNAYTKVKANLGDSPITPDIIKSIEDYVELLDKARYLESFDDENDKDIISSHKDNAQFWLDDALYKAKIQNEEYTASLKEVREEKEKTDEVISHSPTSTVDDSKFDELKADVTEIREELNGVKEKISAIDSEGFEHVKADVEKTVESVKELNSELTEVKSKLDSTSTSPVETNISSGNEVIESQNKIQEELKESVELFDNLGRKIDKTFAKSLSNTKLIDDLGQIITLFHHSAKEFDKFDMSKLGVTKLGQGAYFGFDQTKMSDFDNQTLMSQWYAQVENIFDATSSSTEKIAPELAKQFIEKFLVNPTEDYAKSVYEALTNGGAEAIKAVKQIARQSKISGHTKEMMNFLGYDAILGETSGMYDGRVQTLKELNVLDPNKIFKIEVPSGVDELNHSIEMTKLMIQSTKEDIESFTESSKDLNRSLEERNAFVEWVQDSKQELIRLEDELIELKKQKDELADAYVKPVIPIPEDTIKDTFQGDKIEQATTSAKELDKTLEQAVDVPTDDFDNILTKLDLTKSKLSEIVKITKQTHIDADGKPVESYTLKDKYGSTEIYGESSNPQLLRSNIVEYDAKQAEKLVAENIRINKAYYDAKEKEEQEYQKLKAKFLAEGKRQEQEYYAELQKQADAEVEYYRKRDEEYERLRAQYKAEGKAQEDAYNAQVLKEQAEAWDKNVKAIQEYMDANTKLNNLKAQDAGTGKKAKEIEYNVKKVEELEKVALEARAALSSMINPHEAPINDWNKWLGVMKQFDQATEGSAESLAKLEDSLRNMAKSQSDKIKSVIESNQAHLDKLRPTEGNRSVEFENTVQEYNKAIIALREFHATLDNSTPLTKEQSEKYEELSTSLREARVEMEKFSASEKGSTESSRWKEIDKITKYLEKNTRISKIAKQRLEDLVNTLKNVSGVNVDNIHLQFNKIAEAERAASREGKRFWDIITDKAVYGAAAQLAGYYLSLTDFIRYGKQMVDTVIEIDTALTELRKVSDATEQRLSQNFKNSAETAKELGASISDVISASADWSRMGFDIDESEELARVSTLYVNVGDGIDVEEANNSLISTLQGFQMDAEEAESIVDRFNEVANNYAIDSAGIGEALQRSAASFNASHTDLSKSIALITATNEVVQNPEVVGTLWKTMSARIRGAKTELEELGEETDEYTETTSKLRDLVKGLTGFDIMADEDTFKDIYEIILGIGQEWENLTDVEQASLGEALAGKRSANALYAVLGNLDTLEDVYKTAEKSAGSAMREQENYEKSIQYSLDRLTASAQEWSVALVDSGVIKWFVDLANAIVEVSTAITPLGTLALGGGLFAGIKNVGQAKMWAC